MQRTNFAKTIKIHIEEPNRETWTGWGRAGDFQKQTLMPHKAVADSIDTMKYVGIERVI